MKRNDDVCAQAGCIDLCACPDDATLTRCDIACLYCTEHRFKHWEGCGTCGSRHAVPDGCPFLTEQIVSQR